MRRIAVSLLALVPCFWQTRIQAGDFSSHVYNAWLAGRIDSGEIDGLYLTLPSTNLLFDLLLEYLIRLAGIAWGSKLAVAITVLVFFGGAVAYLHRHFGEKTWKLTPCLLMLAYGWTYHMGLFNFYLGSGLALWALAFGPPERSIKAWTVCSLLLAAAYSASSMPALWGASMLVWHGLAGRLSERGRIALAIFAVAAFWALTRVLERFYGAYFSAPAVPLFPADQLWVYGDKYRAVMLATLVLWACMLLPLTHQRKLLTSAPTLLFLAALICLFLIPVEFQLPGTVNPVSLIQERSSLLAGILLLGAAAQTALPRWQVIASVAVASVFFSFLYVDEKALNTLEDRMEQQLAALEPGSRVVYAVDDSSVRSFAVLQLASRPCAGRCWYYSNYEPVVGHFRIRCNPGNSISVCSKTDQEQMSRGGYVVKQTESPLFELTLCGSGPDHLCVKRLETGQITSPRKDLRVMPKFW